MEAAQELAVITPKDLAHLTDLEKEIAGYKEEFKDLTIIDENDKEGYEQVRKAIGILRPKRTGLEAERKSVVNPYNEAVKWINGQYKGVTMQLEEIEKPLKAKKDIIDDIVENKKQEEERAKEQKINERINSLLQSGASFDGNYYSIAAPDLGISETSVGVVDIRAMSDDLFSQMLQTVVDKNAKIVSEKERIQKEKDKIEADRLESERIEREKFAEQKKELEDQQAALQKQKDDIKAAQDKLDQDKKDAADRQRIEEENRIIALGNSRAQVLVGLGMTYTPKFGTYDYGEIAVPADRLGKMTEPDWVEFMDQMEPEINELKRKAEEKRQADIDAQAKQKKEEETKAEKERLEALSDKDKAKSYLNVLLQVQVPTIKTRKYNSSVQNLIVSIKEILEGLN